MGQRKSLAQRISAVHNRWMAVPESPELLAAIGAVAIESGHAEDELRVSLLRIDARYPDDKFRLLVTGQSWSWIVQHVRLFLREHESSRAEGQAAKSREALLTALRDMDALWDRRNLVLHGCWHTACPDLRQGEICWVEPGPPGPDDFHVDRSRLKRRDEQSEHLSAAGVREIAAQIGLAREAYRSAAQNYREEVKALIVKDWNEMPGWVRDGMIPPVF